MSATPVTTSPAGEVEASIVMLAYNHEPFLTQAIESVLEQEAPFRFELVIGEDHSTDRTPHIAAEYARRHPDRVRVLPAGPKLGPRGNFVRTLRACTGRYVAILEGDDYWTSPHKLRKQVRFLDASPECVQCFHSVVVDVGGGPAQAEVRRPRVDSARSSLRDILRENFIQPCAVMFRREPALRLPAWYHDMPMGGWPLFVLNARFGDTGYLDEPMAAYRVHAGGYWSGQSRLVQQCRRLQVYEAMSAHFRRRHDDVIGPGAFACCYDLAMFHEASGDLRAARACAWRALAWGTARGRCGGRPGAGRQVLRVLLRSSVPAAAYRAARGLRRTLAGPRGCRG